MFNHVDWQMIAFVSVSFVQEYWTNIRFPQICYWDMQQKMLDDDKKAA